MAGENPSEVISTESLDSSSEFFVDSFKGVTSQLRSRFLKYLKFGDFAAKYYPEINKNDPEFMRGVYEQFLTQLEKNIKDDIDILCDEQEVYEKLAQLDRLVKESKLSEDVKAWRPSGDPNEDIRDHRYTCRLAYKQALNTLLENTCAQNKKLEEEVMTNHEEIMMLKEAVTKHDEQNKADLSVLEGVVFNMIENLNQMVDED